MGNNEKVKYYSCASRGRNPDNPNDKNSEQHLEINWTGYSNCITKVNKDCYVLEIYDSSI